MSVIQAHCALASAEEGICWLRGDMQAASGSGQDVTEA